MQSDKLNILLLEPFYGGSHKYFADGLAHHSRHRFTLETLPARFWKWRMRGAALYFAEKIPDPSAYDLVVLSDLMSLSDLKMMWGSACPPCCVYFHENQLAYPLPPGEKMDYQFGFTDITTALAADGVIFNSRFHMNSFFSALPLFIRKMPEYKPVWAAGRIKDKAEVIYPGCSLHDLINRATEDGCGPESPDGRIPLIVWNHRWEFDKNPDAFFRVLHNTDKKLKAEGVERPFELALLGENFQVKPKAFNDAAAYYGDRILQYGFCSSREEYCSWLRRGDITVSTADQENYGISVIEAMAAGCLPLLPGRLSYPEIIPGRMHGSCIYKNEQDLEKRLCALLRAFHENPGNDKWRPAAREELAGAAQSYSWKNLINRYDEYFEGLYGKRVK